MQILVISDAWHPQINGVVRTYEYMMPALVEAGHTMTVIGPEECGISIPCPQYNEIRLSLGGFFNLTQKIDRIRSQTGPANFHLHIATEGPLGWVARRYAIKHNLKFSSCYHTEFPDYIAKRVPNFLSQHIKNLALTLIRNFHKAASAMFVATDSLEEKLRVLSFENAIARLSRGADLAQFSVKNIDIFATLKKPIALYVGRVAVEKNLPAFLDAPWDGAKVIVGTGPDLESLKSKYPAVVFAGKQTGAALAAHYQSADIFVFPSKTDTFGMVIVEALACGLPVAAYPVTGPIDIITNPALGALDNDLSHAMRAALNAPMDKNSRAAHAQTQYSWQRVAEQFIDGINRYCMKP